ncbi:MAG TPA: DmsE family decaheme c-type cytochrome [Pyrinomonadaceae bacterium]|nr:cytochrome C [Chloracidobacterium sp.]HBE82721.1 cytochrome C [Blastocatellia bacterium]HRJ90235.1 DmsE family decaheme c-type cytochrome [Pyrinomonadaceae bacterium]HRK49315.1 DmsE family decaheme c-type cytochrome [Pyrinomonadaceae bacterium]
MASAKNFKLVLLVGFVLFLSVWFVVGLTSPVAGTSASAVSETLLIEGYGKDDNYVGSETCKACHESQFNDVAQTTHGKLGELPDWKNKVVGCESCHGPGKEHVDGGGDKTKIKIFKEMDAKAVSESCLACHAGKENHNNFRRGEHWRNNVGCTDCHSAHGSKFGDFKAGSITNIGDAAAQRPNLANRAMLKSNEPQLCIGCHTETKAQFSKPFHHKVLEGQMSCSDCHNPHGGFESKQTRATFGADNACVRCHTNKQGPFVFEHAPLTLEGCSACHTPHGASNPKMLKRNSVRQLCLECHSSITEQLAPDTPSFHNQAVVRYQNCTICHVAIHGSNTNKDFFR